MFRGAAIALALKNKNGRDCQPLADLQTFLSSWRGGSGQRQARSSSCGCLQSHQEVGAWLCPANS